MHVNYLYLIYKAKQLTRQPDAKILDHGCGSAEVVEEGRKLGLDIYGVDTFYEGANSRIVVEKKSLLGSVVREMEDGKIPFEDDYFDLVTSNQVLEHAEDLDSTLAEINRVLRTDGFFLSLFASKDVLREGHCGIPLLHWFPQKSSLRIYYAATLRLMGLGYHKGNKSVWEWTNDIIEWLDQFTFYRDRKTIFELFQKYFHFSLIEYDYISFRLNVNGHRTFSKIVQIPIIKQFGCELFRKLAGLVVLAQKNND